MLQNRRVPNENNAELAQIVNCIRYTGCAQKERKKSRPKAAFLSLFFRSFKLDV